MRRTGILYTFALIMIFWLGFALRIVDLENLPPFEHYDGANLAEYSQVVLRGEVPWYGVRPDGDTNWAFFQYAPYRLFGEGQWPLRMTSVLWSMLALAAAHYGVKQMFGARVALFTVLLMALGHVLIHFGRVATIVIPSVMTSFLTIGVFLRAQRYQGSGLFRAGLFGLAGGLLAFNLYQYPAARPVFFAIFALWLFSIPRRRAGWPRFIQNTASLAAGGLLVAAPILFWYAQHPFDLYGRLGFLSVFNPFHAPTNTRLYGNVDTPMLLAMQTLRSLGGFAFVWDTSPLYHIEAALLDPATALLLIPGLVLAFRRTARLTAATLVWMAAGLIAGAILLIEPPTSYHYIVLLPLAMIFAALSLDWLSASARGRFLVPLILAVIFFANTNLYFNVYPSKGAWYSLESDVGFYIREQVRAQTGCCTFWYLGEPEATPRMITAFIATPTTVHYMRDDEQLAAAIKPYLADEQPDVIIIPNDQVDRVLPKLQQRFPGGNADFYLDRGRRAFCTYKLPGVRHSLHSAQNVAY